ncbi:MAG: HipA domain-containing protein [Deltaproteobacteria bacterium]|nr:HipA domain-containing protein [Deltaproteobacteria bacterium]
MITDHEAVVWTRIGMRPVKMGRVYITDRECRFTYTEDYAENGLPGLGLIYPPKIVQTTTIVRQRTEFFDLLPPLQALVPPRREKNFQRTLILAHLAKRGILPAAGFEADWEILKIAGHGGMGHLDLFENDEKAAEWYSAPARQELREVTRDFGLSLKDFLTWFDTDPESILEIVGPTPTVGGAIPKLLVSIADDGWDGRLGLPRRIGAKGMTDALLKFEQAGTYPGITELEALTLDIHTEAGFEVPRHWRTEINGIPTLVIERFDRDVAGIPRFMETLHSIFACGDLSITHHYSGSYDAIGRAIDRSPIPLVEDGRAAKEHLLKRLLLSFATGNGDLHLENLSILDREGTLAFSPVYDPTPMRAYAIHDMLAAMPFGAYGEVRFEEALLRLTRNLGFRKKDLLHAIEVVLTVTRSYPERIEGLSALPGKNKKNLVGIVEKIRKDLTKIRKSI